MIFKHHSRELSIFIYKSVTYSDYRKLMFIFIRNLPVFSFHALSVHNFREKQNLQVSAHLELVL
jgi:hypothetical protein